MNLYEKSDKLLKNFKSHGITFFGGCPNTPS